MTDRTKTRTILLTLSLGVAACGGGAADDAASGEAPPAEAPAPSVTITEPASGAVIEGSSVTIVLAVEGIEIAPVAEGRMETAHHHLFLDKDLTPLGEPIPADDPQIVHKGDGSSQHTFEGLAPGEHRVIAVLANPVHIPFEPLAADTVTFTIGG